MIASRRLGPAATGAGPGRLPLKERRGSARPVVLLVFADLLHVVHVSAGLREYVMQVVANADEREPLVEELAHAGGAEQKHAQNDVVLAGGVYQFLRGFIEFGRGVHV